MVIDNGIMAGTNVRLHAVLGEYAKPSEDCPIDAAQEWRDSLPAGLDEVVISAGLRIAIEGWECLLPIRAVLSMDPSPSPFTKRQLHWCAMAIS